MRVRPFLIGMHPIPRQQHQRALLFVAGWLGHLPSRLNASREHLCPSQVTGAAAFVEHAAAVNVVGDEIETEARSCAAINFYRVGTARPTAGEVSLLCARCSHAHISCTAHSMLLTRSLTHIRHIVCR